MRKIDTFYLWSQFQKCVNLWHVNFWVDNFVQNFRIFLTQKWSFLNCDTEMTRKNFQIQKSLSNHI